LTGTRAPSAIAGQAGASPDASGWFTRSSAGLFHRCFGCVAAPGTPSSREAADDLGMRLACLLRDVRLAVELAQPSGAGGGRSLLAAGNARLQTGPVSDTASPAICTAKGCQAAATWAVVWNNPRLHTPDREKVWVACGKHKQPLADYLAVRSFLKRVEPLEAV
jgi:hypothetical protein